MQEICHSILKYKQNKTNQSKRHKTKLLENWSQLFQTDQKIVQVFNRKKTCQLFLKIMKLRKKSQIENLMKKLEQDKK